MVINTNPDVCDRDLISDTPASVDFGTSSTCVAIEGDEKTELLSLSSNDINSDDNNSQYKSHNLSAKEKQQRNMAVKFYSDIAEEMRYL